MTNTDWETWTDGEDVKYEGFQDETGNVSGTAKITYADGSQFKGYYVKLEK